jgi:hypothetical protein
MTRASEVVVVVWAGSIQSLLTGLPGGCMVAALDRRRALGDVS